MASNTPRFVIGVDYGTTYTGVAWVLTTGNQQSRLSDIDVVETWTGGLGPKVPSTYTYSATTGQQWGYGIGNDAYIIRWTKLELEKPLRINALVALHQVLGEAEQLGFSNQNVLMSQIPRHLIKKSSDVMRDYLIEVADCVRKDILSKKDPEAVKTFPIDLIITHPAEWDGRARNLTFRAVVSAFEAVFPEMDVHNGFVRMVTEPEACAQYTMRDAQDLQQLGALRKGECFIVVDAGGGTVDLASYLVEELNPNFRVSLVTRVSGGAFGATRVDDYFLLRFLPQRLGAEDYQKLMDLGSQYQSHGSGSHRVLRPGEKRMLQLFEPLKHGFAGMLGPGEQQPENTIQFPTAIELPDGIGMMDNPAAGIRNGFLTVTVNDMEEMFRESVEGTVALINQQLIQIDRQGLKVKTIFLSGGFSRSEYLSRNWRFTLLRGDDSWTAVAKGAVLMGLGLGCDIPPPNVRCPFHIGILASKRFTTFEHEQSQVYTDTFDGSPRARDHIKWVIARGDMIAPDKGIEKTIALVKKMTRVGNHAGRVQIVTSGYDGPLGPQTNFAVTDASRRVFNLDYDLSSLRQADQHTVFTTATNPQTQLAYHEVNLQLEITATQRGVHAELLCGKTTGMLGGTGAPGYRLREITIPFPG